MIWFMLIAVLALAGLTGADVVSWPATRAVKRRSPVGAENGSTHGWPAPLKQYQSESSRSGCFELEKEHEMPQGLSNGTWSQNMIAGVTSSASTVAAANALADKARR
jgi:hypothetical protein